MEEGLLGQLGIDWKLLLSQAVNFVILLIILRAFVYTPLLAAIKKRNERIKEGLDKAKEADARLHEVDIIAKDYLKKADQQSVEIIRDTEDRAKKLEELLLLKAQNRQQELLAQAQLQYERQQEESQKKVLSEATDLVKKLLVKTVELKPEAIDESLIKKAAQAIANEK